MALYEYLIETYGYNEPIMMNELSYMEYSKPWLSKELAALCASGKLIRFEKGVYYAPKMTVLGPSRLNPQKVIEKKYIASGNERNGYYSGASFLNRAGLSTQVPNAVEIYTNAETAKVREITVGPTRVILRRARTPITKDNVSVQSFLELMNSVSASFFDDERRRITENFIRDSGITKSDITRYAGAFPDKAMRTLVESEMIYSVT